MARNGSGVMTIPNTMVSSTPITASAHNENYSDIGTEITNSVAADGQTTMTGPLKASNGSASLPAHTFGSDPNTGAYRIGADNYGIAVGGSKVVDVASTGVTVTGDTNVTGVVKQTGFELLPVGVIWPYGGTSAPDGYLLCDGSAVSRTTYSALFAIIGTAYGAGDASTTFNVPDMKGRVPAGKEASATRLTATYFGGNSTVLGATGGSESNTLSLAKLPTGITSSGQLADHTHPYTAVTGTNNGATGGNFNAYTSSTTAQTGNPNGTVTQNVTSNNTSGEAHNNTQPTIVVNYIIFAGV